jgi:hypothetical protein
MNSHSKGLWLSEVEVDMAVATDMAAGIAMPAMTTFRTTTTRIFCGNGSEPSSRRRLRAHSKS